MSRAANTLLVLLFASACAPTQTTTVHHGKHEINDITDDQANDISRAEEAIQKKDFAAAEPLLNKALAAAPKNYQGWFDLGFVYNQLGREAESIHAYRQSVAAKPDVFESNLNLGLMLARSNNLEAEAFLRAAAKLKPTDHVVEGQARAWLSLGHLLENTKPEDALDAYQRAAALTPKDSEPHLSAGLLRERRKDFAGAEAEYKQVRVLDPHSDEAVIGLTNIYMKGGRIAEAEPLLRQLAAERPDDAGLHLQLGRVSVRLGEFWGECCLITQAQDTQDTWRLGYRWLDAARPEAVGLKLDRLARVGVFERGPGVGEQLDPGTQARGDQLVFQWQISSGQSRLVTQSGLKAIDAQADFHSAHDER